MLAVARALILNPRIMLLDEPLEGLAPIIIEELLTALRKIIREEGLSAILVEQNAQKILGVTDRAIIIERGSIVYQAIVPRSRPTARSWKLMWVSRMQAALSARRGATRVDRHPRREPALAKTGSESPPVDEPGLCSDENASVS